MNAGLPGTGLGGLFYVVLGLAMPLVEGYRTLQGRSSPARWRQVSSQFAIALTMVAVTVAAAVVLRRETHSRGLLGVSGTGLLAVPALVAAIVLVGLVVVLRVWARLARPVPAPRPGRHRREDLVSAGSDG